MFSLSAPTGELKNFTAVVPVVNCCANVGTVLQYSKHANRSICMKMWPSHDWYRVRAAIDHRY